MNFSEKKRYDPGEIVDAPECYGYSRAFGILTRGTWDHRVRSFEERIGEFVRGFPPEDPMRNFPRESILRDGKGGFVSGSSSVRLARFGGGDWKTGSFHELLARYGLKIKGDTVNLTGGFEPDSAREAATRRNTKLRMLHGGVDVEATNMDAAKAAYLDREESRKAAEEIQAAVKKMQEELREDEGGRSD